MADDASLGTAELELGADLAPLDAKLATAESRVAVSVAAMQKMFDSLHVNADMKLAAADALATKLAAAGQGAPGASVGVAPASPYGGHGGVAGLWGVRGSEKAGSLQNPLVTVMAASKYFPMGSEAAAIGEDAVADVQRGDQSSGVASSADLAALTAAVQNLAQTSTPGSRMATAGTAGLGSPNSSERTVVALDAQDRQAIKDISDRLDKIEQHTSASRPDSSTGGGWGVMRVTKPATATPGPLVIDSDKQPIIVEGAGISTGHQSSTRQAPVSWDLGGPSIGGGGGGAGGTLNRRTDIFHHSAAENAAEGSGSDLLHTILWGETSHLPFTGVGNFAGMGSLGAFAGLGPEHAVVTGLGLASSATEAVAIGGTLKVLGSLGPLLVGAGSDMLAFRSALADDTDQIKQHAQALVTQYKAESQPAQHAAASLANQVIGIGGVYAPLAAQNALRNYTIIQQQLQPFFDWLKGPKGLGVFKDLENEFAANLPHSIGAATQGFELLLRIMDLAGSHAGGLTTKLDTLFTRLNGESNQRTRRYHSRYRSGRRVASSGAGVRVRPGRCRGRAGTCPRSAW